MEYVELYIFDYIKDSKSNDYKPTIRFGGGILKTEKYIGLRKGRACGIIHLWWKILGLKFK